MKSSGSPFAKRLEARRWAGERTLSGVRTRRRRRWLPWLALLPLALSLAQVLVLRWLDPPFSIFMLAHARAARSAGVASWQPEYRWRDWESISPQLPIALVAAEDQKFPWHHGFDLQAIDAALDRNARGGRPRGASTISQQVARNLFLWPDRTWLRKGLEAWYTLLIETLWPKQRILEVYANVAEFGPGIYGAEAAALRYFGKPAAYLSASESAALAAVLPNPRRYSVFAPGPYVRARQHWIEDQARQLGGPEYLRGCCGVPGSSR